MSEIPGYPKVWALGHAHLKDLLLDPVIIEEKIDGSQFSFMKRDGKLYLRSKGVEVLEGAEGMFYEAAEQVRAVENGLKQGWVYRGEYLLKPRHNALAYDRVPKRNIILFDIQPAIETYLNTFDKAEEADRLGFEVVPSLWTGTVDNVEALYGLLETVSCLGGQQIEGFVIKNYNRFGEDKKALMGKYVSEHFKEVHKKSWKTENPNNADLIETIIGMYKTPARWNKAIQHLKERGELENSPKDIGKLIAEIQSDIETECGEEIKNLLYNRVIGKIRRGVSGGAPEYYKQVLLESQFHRDDE